MVVMYSNLLSCRTQVLGGEMKHEKDQFINNSIPSHHVFFCERRKIRRWN